MTGSSLRRRWTAAFAVLLVLMLATGAAAWLFGARVVGSFGGAAARLDAADSLTTDLRREITDHEHRAHAIVNAVPIDTDAYLAQESWIAARFANGGATLSDDAQRKQLAEAAGVWRASLASASVWGGQVRADRTRPTDLAPHVALADGTQSVLSQLDRVNADVRTHVNRDLAAARRVEGMTFLVLAGLFLAAVGVTVWSWARLKSELLDPVDALQQGVGRLRDGGLGDRVEVGSRAGNTELGELASAFNEMAGTVERSQRQRAALLKRSLESGEQERIRVANELHDGPIQRLAAVSYLIDATLVRAGEGSPGTETLAAVRVRIADEIDGLRRLMADLRPPLLDHGGLAAGLDDYVAEFSAEQGVPVTLDARIGRARLDPSVETVAYRLVQEALTNVRRHARATAGSVVLRRDGDVLAVTVTDDGVGFDREAAGAEHFGLAAMAERVASIGGTFQLVTAPGEGTVVHARIPTTIETVAPAVDKADAA